MGCKTIDLGGGALAIVCSRGHKPRALCEACKSEPHAVLCDYPLSGPKAGKTCDRKLCARCAVHAGPNRDLCPAHAKLGLPQTELPL